MSAAALWDLLPDFGAANDHSRAPPAAQPAQEQPAEPDVDALIAAAVARAETALEARLAEAHQAQLAAEREAAASDAQALMESFGSNIGALISGRLEQLQQQLCETMEAAAARTIGGVLSDTLRERSLAALADTIASTLDEPDAIRMKVQGPAHLFEALCTALGDHAGQLDFVETPGFDLTISVNETVIETRMGEWSAALSGIVS
ncbi:hypothetical protein [Aquamicrobium ahrensii]|uniref:Flagellar assembly protein FliH/Type III secretion system HrpE domain-containing protein n=1 Tax=Aquamicrobium ahrensii TaxID=469551 RepID=A0ABV2KLJ2_9HYPH